MLPACSSPRWCIRMKAGPASMAQKLNRCTSVDTTRDRGLAKVNALPYGALQS